MCLFLSVLFHTPPPNAILELSPFDWWLSWVQLSTKLQASFRKITCTGCYLEIFSKILLMVKITRSMYGYQNYTQLKTAVSTFLLFTLTQWNYYSWKENNWEEASRGRRRKKGKEWIIRCISVCWCWLSSEVKLSFSTRKRMFILRSTLRAPDGHHTFWCTLG